MLTKIELFFILLTILVVCLGGELILAAQTAFIDYQLESKP